MRRLDKYVLSWHRLGCTLMTEATVFTRKTGQHPFCYLNAEREIERTSQAFLYQADGFNWLRLQPAST